MKIEKRGDGFIISLTRMELHWLAEELQSETNPEILRNMSDAWWDEQDRMYKEVAQPIIDESESV